MKGNLYIEQILKDADLEALIQQSSQRLRLRAMCIENSALNTTEVELSCRLAFLLIGASFGENTNSAWADYAYKLLKNISVNNENDINVFNQIMGYDLEDPLLVYYFYLSSLALRLDKTISARLDLKEYEYQDKQETSWSNRVLAGIFRALFFLIRKSNGFSDIRKAIEEISTLQKEQIEFEEQYLSSFDTQVQTKEAMILVGLYHTSKAITEMSDYLIKGYSYKKRINVVIRQHIDIALDFIPKDERLRDFIYIINKDLLSLVRNSIWQGTAFHDQIKKLCEFKSSNNVLELLPSQRQAMEQNLFDVYANASIIQMPTSAGKTMLAEFNIVLTKSLRQDAKVVYVVPSRALVNQVYFDLRTDLTPIGLNVERTSSATEIDPTEADFLIADDVDVIVSTPEKLDLLIRRSHPSVEDVSLFIIDEAHTIENGERGARLELLVAMLRRERPNAKYMLLSPFLPRRTDVLAEWLGGGNIINVDWKPSEKGCTSLFSEILGRGVAVHHAGLSDEVKLLTEHLIRKGLVNYVCATTTIAEGVNFPVSSVYFDTYQRGTNNILSANDFWNIAGRAGRTMVDDFGKIILPFNSDKNKETGIEILRKGAEELTSVLSKLFVDREYVLNTLIQDKGLEKLMYRYTDAFIPISRYFVHLLTVSKNEHMVDLDELFKDSLVYYMLENEQQKNEFIELCKQIYLTIQTKYADNIGILKYADKTGFSIPSVLKIMQQKSTNADLNTWNTDVMFDRNNPINLTAKIKAISELRETGLGTDDKSAPFNPELVARILIQWVKGDKINTISTTHPHFISEDTNKRLTEFVTYINQLRFKASWGLSALEGIVKGNEDEMKDSYIPSYVYYGVDSSNALAMRMLGIPRSMSSSLSNVISGNISEYSFSKLRNIIQSLSLNDWDSLKPQQSRLSGEEWKYIVNLLMR